MVLLVLVDTDFQHRLTDLHLSKVIMMVLTFRGISKFASVNPATEALISDGFVKDLLSFMPKLEDNQICDEPRSLYISDVHLVWKVFLQSPGTKLILYT